MKPSTYARLSRPLMNHGLKWGPGHSPSPSMPPLPALGAFPSFLESEMLRCGSVPAAEDSA